MRCGSIECLFNVNFVCKNKKDGNDPSMMYDCNGFEADCGVCQELGFQYYKCADCSLTEEEYYEYEDDEDF